MYMAQSTCSRKRSNVRKRRRRRQRIHWIKQTCICVLIVFLICGGIVWLGSKGENTYQTERFLKSHKNDTIEYPEELLEMLERNSETYDFVTDYPQREKYMGKDIDLTGEVKNGKVPLFMQWDKRWGYDSYGSEMIAMAGCGPTCMSMAYVYLTGQTDFNPRTMAEFADENGYNTEAGTSWNFFTDGAAGLGLQGVEIGLDEDKMREELKAGNVIICSMRREILPLQGILF